jgi:hypothetical protein
MADERSDGAQALDRGAPRLGVRPEVYARHLEEFHSLWFQRKELLNSDEMTARDLAAWDDRMAAHLDALISAGGEAIPLLAPHLAGDDSAAVFAAAYVLLVLMDAGAADCVMKALAEAQGGQLAGLSEALRHGPVELAASRLQEAVASAPPPIAAAAAEALAFHERLDPQNRRLAEFFDHEDPQVRQCAWRIVALAERSGSK